MAEDNLVCRAVILRQLLKLGYTARAVGDGTEVLTALAESPYGLILMDCHMPRMDGYTASRSIREQERALGSQGKPGSPARIIAMSANPLADERDQCLAAGMDACLCKPLQIEELRAALAGVQPGVRLPG